MKPTRKVIRGYTVGNLLIQMRLTTHATHEQKLTYKLQKQR